MVIFNSKLLVYQRVKKKCLKQSSPRDRDREEILGASHCECSGRPCSEWTQVRTLCILWMYLSISICDSVPLLTYIYIYTYYTYIYIHTLIRMYIYIYFNTYMYIYIYSVYIYIHCILYCILCVYTWKIVKCPLKRTHAWDDSRHF